MLPPQPPPSNVDQVFRGLLEDVCHNFRNDQVEEAHEVAWLLYQEPALPLAMRAHVACMLGTGDGDYVKFAKEGVELFEQIVSMGCTACFSW